MRTSIHTQTILGWALAGALVFGALACGTDDSVCGPGNDQVPALMAEGDLNTFWVGAIAIGELKMLGTEVEHDTLVTANFNDFSDYMVGLAPRLEFLPDYPACYVVTGKPDIQGAPSPLGVESVSFSGLSESVSLEPDGSGRLPVELLNARGFTAEEVGIEVASAGGEHDFPAFSESLPAPLMPAPGRIGDTSWDELILSAEPSIGIDVGQAYPLVVEWEPGGGDAIEIMIIPNANSETDFMKLRCITFDDGCLEIPAGAIGHLALDAATNFKLRLERHSYAVHSIREGDSVKAAAIIDLSAALETIVIR